jgi:hypothetical protein
MKVILADIRSHYEENFLILLVRNLITLRELQSHHFCIAGDLCDDPSGSLTFLSASRYITLPFALVDKSTLAFC